MLILGNQHEGDFWSLRIPSSEKFPTRPLTDGGPWRSVTTENVRPRQKSSKKETKEHETSHAVVYKTSVSHFMVKITPPKDTDGKGKFISLFLYMLHSQTSLILTPKGQSKVSVLERCPYKKGHNDDVTFDSTYSFKI